MTQIDSLSIVCLTAGLLVAIVTYIFAKRNNPKPTLWPRLLGLYGLALGFAPFMAYVLLFRPMSDLPQYAFSACFWSSLIGLSAFLSGKIIEHYQVRR